MTPNIPSLYTSLREECKSSHCEFVVPLSVTAQLKQCTGYTGPDSNKQYSQEFVEGPVMSWECRPPVLSSSVVPMLWVLQPVWISALVVSGFSPGSTLRMLTLKGLMGAGSTVGWDVPLSMVTCSGRAAMTVFHHLLTQAYPQPMLLTVLGHPTFLFGCPSIGHQPQTCSSHISFCQ